MSRHFFWQTYQEIYIWHKCLEINISGIIVKFKSDNDVTDLYLTDVSDDCYQGPLLLTWFNFNPSMDM